MEIVEIGAVRINTANPSDTEQHFSILVQPVHNPQLSEYFIKLTSISQQRLDSEAVSLKEALDAFQTFANGTTHFYSYGEDGDIISQNCALLDINNPLNDKTMVNARAAIKASYGLDHHITSADLPDAVGILVKNTPLRAHQALDDARAVAAVLVPLLRDPDFSSQS